MRFVNLGETAMEQRIVASNLKRKRKLAPETEHSVSADPHDASCMAAQTTGISPIEQRKESSSLTIPFIHIPEKTLDCESEHSHTKGPTSARSEGLMFFAEHVETQSQAGELPFLRLI